MYLLKANLKRYESQTNDRVKVLKNLSRHPFSKMKVVNEIQNLHPCSHQRYSIRIDRKFLKLRTKKIYRREGFYKMFCNIYQVLDVTFLNIERAIAIQIDKNVFLIFGTVKKVIEFFRFNIQRLLQDFKRKEIRYENR